MAGLMLLAAGVPAQEDEDPQFLRDLTDAYITFGRANRAREAGEQEEARRLFEDALAQYQRLHNLYPDLQAEIVQYRIADCANQVESLRHGVGSEADEAPLPAGPAETPGVPEPPAAEAPLPIPEEAAAGTLDEQRMEIVRLLETVRSAAEQLQARQAAVGAELTRSREESAGQADRRQKMREDLQALAAEIEAARARLNPAAGATLDPPPGDVSGDSEMRRMMAQAMRRLQQYDEAVAVLQESLAADPNNAALHGDLGAVWVESGKSAEARQELERALALDPALGDAHLNLARVLAGGTPDDREAARSHYQRALDLGVSADPGLKERLEER